MSLQHHKISYSQHQRGLNTIVFSCPLFHTGFRQMLEEGKITPKGGGKKDCKHSTLGDPPSAALGKNLSDQSGFAWLDQMMRGKEWEEFFLDTPRRDMTFIISWNLRLKRVTKGLKVQKSYKEVPKKSTGGCSPIWPGLFWVFLCFVRGFGVHMFRPGVFLCSAL